MLDSTEHHSHANFISMVWKITHSQELQEFIELADTLEKELISNLQKKIDEPKGFTNKKKRAFCNLIIGVCIMSLYFNDEGL